MARKRRKGQERRIARERMEILFGLAREAALDGKPERARRYVALARRVGMRYNVPVPRGHKGEFCKGCGAYLVPSRTARVRIGRGRVRLTCLQCGRIARHPYQREKAAQ